MRFIFFKHFIPSAILFFLILGRLSAQNDSIILANAHWNVDTINGMVLKTVHFTQQEYFHSNQFISILEINPNADVKLQYAYEPKRTRTSTMAKSRNAVAAVNGSFFDMDNHNPICHLRIDSIDIGENTPGKDSVNRKYYQYGTLVFNDKDVRIVHTDSARLWERTLPDKNIMTAGPLLIYHGKDQPMRNDLSFVNNRHNRTAVGIKPDGTILLFTVDGRTKQSEGMTLDELIATLRWLGCQDALNLDGGGSTTMYVKGQPYNGIVNYPSDNLRFDHNGERAVSNSILVVKSNQ